MLGARHAFLLFTLSGLLFFGLDADLPPFLPPPPEPPVARLPVPPRVELPPLDPRPPVFFGEELPAARRIAYVLDYSNSMNPDRWARLRREVGLSLRNLPDGVEFAALLYGCSVEPFSDGWSGRELAPAAIAWLESRPVPWETRNATGTAQAVVYALAMRPDLVLLLTDGYPGGCGLTRVGVDPMPTHLRVIREANALPVPVWVWCLQGDQPAQRFCSQVASESGGTYVYVP